MSSQVLVVIGSGPGIGLSTASTFAVRKFDKIALVARDTDRLSKDREGVLKAAKAAGRDVEVFTFSQDIGATVSFQRTLKNIEELGIISCVLFNAARVNPSDLLTFEEKEVVEDFMITNIGLLTTARWAMPLLEKLKATDKPSLLVTNSLLWEFPVPQYFALSMVKTSQRCLVRCLEQTYPDIHIALLNVGGIVSPQDPVNNPKAIGEKFWQVYEQEKEEWVVDVTMSLP